MTEASTPTLTYQADILSNIILTEQTGELSDTYIISPAFDDLNGNTDLKCHLLNTDSANTKEKFHFPLPISGLLDNEETDPAFRQFNRCLNKPLAHQLINANLDYLDCYVAIQRRPELEKLINKPLLLLIIVKYWSRFQRIRVANINDLSSWLMEVLQLQNVTLTKGKIRCLARLDYTNREFAVSVTRLILRRFQQLYRRFPHEGVIDPSAVQQLSKLINARPELAEARWLNLDLFTSGHNWKTVLDLYNDTRYMLIGDGDPTPERRLLTLSTIEELDLLHERCYLGWKSPTGDPNTPLTTWNIEDGEHFKVIRIVSGLIGVGEELENCAVSYFSRCIDGESVLIRYQRADEVALLQIQFEDSPIPKIGQFYGPNNTPVSQQAWLDLFHWIETSETGPIATFKTQLKEDCRIRMKDELSNNTPTE